MREIRLELAGAARGPPPPALAAPVLTPPTSAAEALRAHWQRASSADVPDAVQLRRQGFRAGLVVTAAVALGLVALALFIVPAMRTPAPVASRAATAPAAVPATEETAPPAAPDLEKLAQQKSAADELRSRASARLTALLAADSASWAAAGTRAAQEKLAVADTLMQKRDYGAAQVQLSEVMRELPPLEAQRGPALQAALQRGQAGLDQGQSGAATAAFAEALRIGPTNAAAVRGARRAASLDAVNAQLARAHELERQGQTAAAGVAYRQALALDADSPDAQRGAARTGGQLRDDQFGHVMARAYAAINSGRVAEARAALDEARRLKPEDPEIARAVAQLAARDAAAQLAEALAQARGAESAERWQDAVAQYQRALALDPTLVDARRALAVAQQRAQLDVELESTHRPSGARLHRRGLRGGTVDTATRAGREPSGPSAVAPGGRRHGTARPGRHAGQCHAALGQPDDGDRLSHWRARKLHRAGFAAQAWPLRRRGHARRLSRRPARAERRAGPA